MKLFNGMNMIEDESNLDERAFSKKNCRTSYIIWIVLLIVALALFIRFAVTIIVLIFVSDIADSLEIMQYLFENGAFYPIIVVIGGVSVYYVFYYRKKRHICFPKKFLAKRSVKL